MNKMSVETFNCLPCKYKITKKHLYEKHLKSEAHLKVQAKADLKVQAKADLKVQAKADLKVQAKADLKVQAKAEVQAETESNKTSATVKEKQKQLCICGNYYKSLLAHQKSCQTFKKEKEKGNVSDNANSNANVNSNANPTTPNIDYPAPINKALYEKATADFKKYMGDNDDDDIQNTIENLKDNDSTTITTIVDDAGNTIIEKTTYSTTNTTTDYDVHLDSADFIKMMNTSLATLKESGDRKAFVHNFFEYMFRHVTDIRHTTDE